VFLREILPPSSGSEKAKAKEEAGGKQSIFYLHYLLAGVTPAFLPYSLTLKMGSGCFSKMSVGFYWSTLIKLEYLELTVHRRGVGEVFVVVERAPTC
jgi:hypothetical protein